MTNFIQRCRDAKFMYAPVPISRMGLLPVPYKLDPNSKTEKHRETQIGVNILVDRSNRCWFSAQKVKGQG